MPSDEVAIRIDNLSKSYHLYDTPRDRLKQFIFPRLFRMIKREPKNYFREFWALQDISLEIKKGESVAIIGRNGSGKSTLLQIVAGVINPTRGRVEINGRVVALLELGSGFNPEFTGRENVYMNAAILGIPPDTIEQRFHEIAEFADIGDFIEQPVKTYSSGMMVRLAFAVSVFVDPDILIVDEALAVGDAAFQIKCLDRLKELTQSGVTLLFVSHDMGMVKNFCDNALYIHGGRQRAYGSPEEMAELYFMEMRNEQRQLAKDGTHVTLKNFVGQGKGVAFGTDEGRIVAAYFSDSESNFGVYRFGEKADIYIEVVYHANIKNPSLYFIVQDRKMINIGGRAFPLSGSSVDGEWVKTNLGLRFPVNFSAGRYHITVRLENRQTDLITAPIDKQVGALSFEVIGHNGDFVGPVNINVQKT